MAHGFNYPTGQNSRRVDKDKFRAMVECPVISANTRIYAAGTTSLIEIPPGAIITRVGLWNTGTAFTSASVSVGTTGNLGLFLDKVSDMGVNAIKFSGLGGTVNANPMSGQYWPDGGTIKLAVTTSSTPGTDDASVKVLVWYTMT